jgi:hypothetical protein
MVTTYKADIVAWANEQARLLRSGQLSAIDIENIAEEILDVGRSEQRELENRMSVLLAHLLKWEFQPKFRGTSWELTIREQRKSVLRRLRKTPSLRSSLSDPDWLEDAWADAAAMAVSETGMARVDFPENCTWTMENILADGWFPA